MPAIRTIKAKDLKDVHRLREQKPRGSAAMICPHCGERGYVTTKVSKHKVGVSGGKATAAVMTAGLSLFATGLSRKQKLTDAHCSNCGASWTF